MASVRLCAQLSFAFSLINKIGNEWFKVYFCVRRILAEDVSRKYLTLLVNALSRCAILLVAEYSVFNTNLVCEFCHATLGECMKAQTIERLPAVCITTQLITLSNLLKNVASQ